MLEVDWVLSVFAKEKRNACDRVRAVGREGKIYAISEPVILAIRNFQERFPWNNRESYYKDTRRVIVEIHRVLIH